MLKKVLPKDEMLSLILKVEGRRLEAQAVSASGSDLRQGRATLLQHVGKLRPRANPQNPNPKRV